MRGNHIVVLEKFDAEICLKSIEQYQVDWIFMVPTMMQRIWRLDQTVRQKADLSSLRILLHAAAPCPVWLKQHWVDWLGPQTIHELYGGTEANGSTWITGEEWLAHKGSVGRVMSGSQAKIVDEHGHRLPPGEIGELYFLPDAGQGSTYHYMGAVARELPGGWETLGDMASISKDGYIYLADRKKDLILCGGANIYPAEVEAAINAHPQVQSCAVVGVPHEDLGQAVHAVVEVSQHAENSGGEAPELSHDLLCDFLVEYLVRYKIPRSFEFVNNPVRDDAGKVRRSELLVSDVASKDD